MAHDCNNIFAIAHALCSLVSHEHPAPQRSRIHVRHGFGAEQFNGNGNMTNVPLAMVQRFCSV